MPVLDWTTANSGIMYRGGKVIKSVNARTATAGTDLPAEMKQIVDPFEAADATDLIASIYSDYEGFQDGQVAIRQQVANYFGAILGDRTRVIAPLGLTAGTSAVEFWEAFLRTMALDTQSVLKSTVSVGSVTPGSGNVGNGTILVTTNLDGFNSPIRGGPALRAYAGLVSQLAVASETMLARCVQDAGNGAIAGQETLAVSGGIEYTPFDWRGEGSGSGPSLVLAGGGDLIDNGGFDDWSGLSPVSWTIDAGDDGVGKLDTPDAYRGASGLILTGDGVLTSIKLGQSLANRSLDPLRLYALTCRLYGTSGGGSNGDFRVGLAGTGYTPGVGEEITGNVDANLNGDPWTLYNSWILMPATIPSDLAIEIEFNGTPDAGNVFQVDELALTPVVYHGGLGMVAVPGSTDCVRGDRWSWTVANDDAGKFQQFARKWLRVQLRSATSGSETIGNSLAT